MRKLESQAETNAGARHADVGDAPLIFEVPHAAGWASILTVNKLGGFIPIADNRLPPLPIASHRSTIGWPGDWSQ
jgi:hypothetical protein